MNITTILTVYKRPHMLDEQISALNKQTIPPKEIWLWVNKSDVNFDKSKYSKYNIVDCNVNFKFHGRFALGLLCKTGHIAIFDDDTIPNSKWFENCQDTFKTVGGNSILGTTGVKLLGNNYSNHTKYGWNSNKNESPEKVHLVGHSWVFPKEVLKYMWYEEPLTWDNGEDIQFSYMAHKYGKISTFVPPHPKGNKELWGSNEKIGMLAGNDNNSTYRTAKNHTSLRNMICQNYIKQGWNING